MKNTKSQDILSMIAQRDHDKQRAKIQLMLNRAQHKHYDHSDTHWQLNRIIDLLETIAHKLGVRDGKN